MKNIKTETRKIPRAEVPQAGEVHRIKGAFRSNAWIWVPAVLVAAATFVIFLPSLGYEFINYDDDRFIYDNPNITSMGSDFFRWAFTNRQYQWSPLRWISHALDYKLWGLKAAGHHLSSVLLHSLNAFLVVILVAKLFEMRKRQTPLILAEEEDRGFRRKALLAGVITGLLFSIHPLRVESVAWVSERKDVLFAFFFLLSLISYLSYYRHRDPDNSQKKPVYYLLALVFFVMSVMSKAAAVTLPLVLVLLDFYPLKRIEFRSGPSVWRKVLVEKLPFFALSALSCVLTFLVQRACGAVTPLAMSFIAMPTFAGRPPG